MDNIKQKKIKAIIFILVFITFLLDFLIKDYPYLLEQFYSDTINRYTRIFISNVTGILPFSLSEVLVIIGLCILILMIFKFIKALLHKSGINELSDILVFLSLLYILFMFSWGYNYNRYSLEELIGLEVNMYSSEQLSKLCISLIEEANSLRDLIIENQEGIMIANGNYRDIINRAEAGYNKLSEKIPQLRGNYGNAKPLLISPFMMYTGITGIYIPYTAEANINILADNYSLPHIVSHEMAHQRGFAPENEANYIAYLACMESPYNDFKYSGAITALVYAMNALRKNDYNTYLVLRDSFSEGVNRDLAYGYQYWQQYEGPVEKVATTVNNTYLVSNGLSEGVQSYGKMVDLLLAYYIKTGELY